MNIVEGIKVLIYGMGGVFFFSAFMYVMTRLIVEVFKDKE